MLGGTANTSGATDGIVVRESLRAMLDRWRGTNQGRSAGTTHTSNYDSDMNAVGTTNTAAGPSHPPRQALAHPRVHPAEERRLRTGTVAEATAPQNRSGGECDDDDPRRYFLTTANIGVVGSAGDLGVANQQVRSREDPPQAEGGPPPSPLPPASIGGGEWSEARSLRCHLQEGHGLRKAPTGEAVREQRRAAEAFFDAFAIAPSIKEEAEMTTTTAGKRGPGQPTRSQKTTAKAAPAGTGRTVADLIDPVDTTVPALSRPTTTTTTTDIPPNKSALDPFNHHVMQQDRPGGLEVQRPRAPPATGSGMTLQSLLEDFEGASARGAAEEAEGRGSARMTELMDAEAAAFANYHPDGTDIQRRQQRLARMLPPVKSSLQSPAYQAMLRATVGGYFQWVNRIVEAGRAANLNTTETSDVDTDNNDTARGEEAWVDPRRPALKALLLPNLDPTHAADALSTEAAPSHFGSALAAPLYDLVLAVGAAGRRVLSTHHDHPQTLLLVPCEAAFTAASFSHEDAQSTCALGSVVQQAPVPSLPERPTSESLLGPSQNAADMTLKAALLQHLSSYRRVLLLVSCGLARESELIPSSSGENDGHADAAGGERVAMWIGVHWPFHVTVMGPPGAEFAVVLPGLCIRRVDVSAPGPEVHDARASMFRPNAPTGDITPPRNTTPQRPSRSSPVRHLPLYDPLARTLLRPGGDAPCGRAPSRDAPEAVPGADEDAEEGEFAAGPYPQQGAVLGLFEPGHGSQGDASEVVAPDDWHIPLSVLVSLQQEFSAYNNGC